MTFARKVRVCKVCGDSTAQYSELEKFIISFSNQSGDKTLRYAQHFVWSKERRYKLHPETVEMGEIFLKIS
jgi:hypothetical protein